MENNIKAIVYTSNTGSTERYARMLAQELKLRAYRLSEAKQSLAAGTEIIYLGWLMAGSVKGYADAAKRYQIRAVVGVGMAQSGTQLGEVREKNRIPADTPLFTLQGNFDLQKLRGIYKLMMQVMVKKVGKELATKTDRSPQEDELLCMLTQAQDYVKPENLNDMLAWLANRNKAE